MVFFVNIIVIFTEYQYLNLEHVTKVTESVTLDEFCNFLFYSFIVNIITKLQHTEQSAMQKNVERDVTLTVKVVVSKIYIFCSCRSSDIVLYLT